MSLQLDSNAEVLSEHRIEILASPEEVWSVHTDIAAWPVWMELITAATLDGGLKPGGIIRWSIGGFDIASQLVEVVPERHLAWQGSDGIHQGIHIWKLVPQRGATLLINSESISGVADPAKHQTLLDQALSTWNLSLKERVESLRTASAVQMA